MKASTAIDLVARKEFDYAVRDVAEGRDWAKIPGISYRRNGAIVHNPEPLPLTTEQLDALPFVTQIYQRDLDYLKYNSPYCQYPYVSLYTGRGCPARCTFCLWPQVTTGHSYRTRSAENGFEEVKEMQRLFPQMKEIFFDDDTFTADPPRARKLAELFKPLGRLLVDQLARQRRSRDAARPEGRRTAAVRRRLRVRQRPDLEEHQEGRQHSSAPVASPRTATTSAF